MKHFKICILLFTIVISFSTFIDIQVSAILDTLIADVCEIISLDNPLQALNAPDSILIYFNENKNMLHVLLNKEHILNIDILIHDLDIAFKNNDVADIQKISNELYLSLNRSKSGIFSLV